VNQPPPERCTEISDWPCGLVSCTTDGVIREVNNTFLGWTGYRRTDLVGRRRLRDLLTVGGRMLYETHLGPLMSMYGQVTEIALDVQRADGKPLPVLVNAAVRAGDASGDTEPDVRFSIIVVNERRSYEKELLEARRLAEAAGAASERVQRQLSLMADVNLILSGTLDLDVALQGLATMLATERFGYCVIITDHDDRDHRLTSAAAVHPDVAESAAALVAVLERAIRPGAADLASARTALTHALKSLTPQLIANVSAEFGTTLIVPVRARGHRVATVVLTRPAGAAPYAGDDLIEFAGLADRIGLFVDNLRLYGREHDRAIALQQALLTPPPKPAGLEIVTRYLPSADGAMVGGDWYDAFIRPDGATVVVIGDVSGHDHVAAAAMGQLRGLLRSLAYTGGQSPAELLSAVDAAARGLGVSKYATAVVAVVLPNGPGAASREVAWASAGHLPPALITAAGEVMLLDAKPDLMLGVDPARPRRNRQFSWEPHSTLLLYTDGLVEDARRSLDDGLAELVAVLADLAAEPLDTLCTEVVGRMSATHRTDDIALLAVRGAALEPGRT
jgi:serine phosphatase RsbU (regulator of sigma subunit)